MKIQTMILKTEATRVIALAVMVTAMILGTNGFAQAAQTGVIAFTDVCTGLLYATRGDGSGRIELPLPQRPLPTQEFVYRQPRVLDVTTHGPLTVVYFVVITPVNSFSPVDYGLFAVQLNDVGGTLTADLPARLDLPLMAGIDPNTARRGAFHSTGDRLALVVNNVLMTARAERDSAMKIIGLSDLIVVGDLTNIGIPDPGFPTSNGFTGYVDYAPDGTSIVASIYYDLWSISLNTDHTYLNAERLTENTDGFAEWNPSYSPDGSHIAYTAGQISGSGGARNLDVYSITLASRTGLRVTKGSDGPDSAMWSPDSASIGFTAFTNAPRNSPCSTWVNSEIFQIKADGSIKATKITNTNGTSVEAWPKWGW